MTARSGQAALNYRLQALGYELGKEELDAAYQALNTPTGMSVKLEDYTVRSVTSTLQATTYRLLRFLACTHPAKLPHCLCLRPYLPDRPAVTVCQALDEASQEAFERGVTLSYD